MSDPIEVLEFWLHEIGPKGWYVGGDEIDGLCVIVIGARLVLLDPDPDQTHQQAFPGESR